ncbi:deSI-like protein At4g17486 [Impatiens glandulifera]|uniref:deSI-like protein At4g17486 n=1 Tax=Impatiens glandulifera TaxID=253017 RepID=UPI001FB178A8|nr:deSI-like protein At4g17486 [Impatiens glandulifera]
MTDVILHVYDVTNSGSDKTNNTILQINKIFKDGIGIGGIFHSAVQVHGEDEWSFGYCEQGSGVFSCPASKNPMYTYREYIILGKTSFPKFKVNQILRELSREWSGDSYDLLSKNCNHFCDELSERLGVPKPPGWINRFAHAGDAAVEIAENTAYRFRQAKTEIASASKVAYHFLVNIGSNSMKTVDQESTTGGNINRGGIPKFQSSWFKNLISAGDKPPPAASIDNSTRLGLEKQEETAMLHQQDQMYERLI